MDPLRARRSLHRWEILLVVCVCALSLRSAAQNPAPILSSISPVAGPAGGGTAVIASGSNFLSGAALTFGSLAASNVVVVNSTTITAITVPSTPGVVNVTVTNPDGQTSTLANGYTYNPPPALTSISPVSGPVAGGAAVTLSGANFLSGATVSFGNALLTNIVVVNSTTITATTPAGAAGAVNVSVSNPDGQTSTLANGYTYNPPPALTSISPVSGPVAGGAAVTLSGANFLSGATVSFGNALLTNIVVVNSTTITATTPAGAAGAVNVSVSNPDGQTSTLTNGYTYNPPPTLTSISPATGSANGGTAVTISGANFLSGATLSFNGSALTNVTVASDTTIMATAPAGAAGVANVTATNPDGQSAADVAVVMPTTNPGFESGGAGWSWNGSGSAKIIKNASLAHSGNNFAQLTSGVGNHPTYGGLSAGSQYFPVTAGNIITFGGWAQSVSGNGDARWSIQLTDVNRANPTYVFTSNATASAWTLLQNTYTVPAGKVWMRFYAEIYSNTVAAQADFDDAILQQQVAPALYTYLPPPAIASVSPNAGNTIGGTAATIAGSNFVSGATVTFGSTAAASVQVVNGTKLTATIPASAAGSVNVTVTNPDSDSATLASGYTYIAPPAPLLTSLSPAAGSTNGGTSVALTGTNFLPGAIVTFGGAAATGVVVTATAITGIAPPGLAGAANVVVTNPDGQFSALGNAYNYVSPPSMAASFFGLHIHRAADVPTVNYGTCRIWGVAGAFWPQIEAQAGVFDFTALDGILADAKQAGIIDGCVFTFGATPAWISSNPTDPNCDTSPGACWPPTDLNFDGTGTDQSVIDAITAIATHVNDPTYLQTHAHVKYWEPWNEPYRSSVLSGTVCSPAHLCSFNGSYAELVRIAQDLRATIQAIDPTALIVTPSGNAYFQVNGQLVVANFLDCANSPRAGSGCTTGNSGSNAVDVINTHCYVWSQNPDDVIGYIQAMRALLSPTDLAKPFLCDEGGWGTDSTTADPDLQAGFLARWFVDIASQNVLSAGWYAWDDAAWGTLWNPKGKGGCTQTSGCLTSAGVAYEQVNSWLVGATLGTCTVSGAVTSCPLSRGGGYQAEMVWVNTTLANCAGQSSAETCGSTPYSVPSQFITKCDLAGVCQAPQSVEMIGVKPLLFKNQ